MSTSAAKEDLTSAIEFEDAGPREVPVKYAGKEYVLREATGAAAKEFKAGQLDSIGYDPDTKKPSRFKSSILDAQARLISRCLFHVGGETPNAPVAVATLLTWPERLVQQVFKRLSKISDLDQDDDADSIKEKIAALQKELERKETAEARLGKS